MKKKLIYLGLTGCILFALCTRLQAQIDSLQTHRYVTRATMYGVGFTNVFDTYLSPQEYKGIDFRISRETIRMTKLFDGNVSVQNFFQADIGYTHNRADNNNTFSGLVNWNYGLHYQFRLTENFKLLAGGLIDANGGFVYNLRNTNNPCLLYTSKKREFFSSSYEFISYFCVDIPFFDVQEDNLLLKQSEDWYMSDEINEDVYKRQDQDHPPDSFQPDDWRGSRSRLR